MAASKRGKKQDPEAPLGTSSSPSPPEESRPATADTRKPLPIRRVIFASEEAFFDFFGL